MISLRELSFSKGAASEELGSRPTAINTPFGREIQGLGARHLPDGDTGQRHITNKLNDFISNVSLQVGYASRPLHYRCIGPWSQI